MWIRVTRYSVLSTSDSINKNNQIIFNDYLVFLVKYHTFSAPLIKRSCANELEIFTQVFLHRVQKKTRRLRGGPRSSLGVVAHSFTKSFAQPKTLDEVS